MFRWKALTAFILVLIPTLLIAQPESDEPAAVALYLKDELVDAVNKKQLDKITSMLASNVVIILENAQTFYTKEDFKTYLSTVSLEKLKIGSFAIAKATIDKNIELLDKNSFIATGTLDFDYQLLRGKTIHVPVRWMATVTQQDKNWLITSYQGTINVLDNPLTDQMRHDLYMICFITLILGFIIGIAWKKFFKKPK